MATHSKTLRAVVVALLVALSAALLPAGSASAAIVDPFTKVFSATVPGDVALAGNTLMTCKSADVGCLDTRAGRDVTKSNNDFAMANVDADDTTTTYNSSSSVLDVPEDSKVLYAGFVWSGLSSTTSRRSAMKVKFPGSDVYEDIRSDKTVVTGNRGRYLSYKALGASDLAKIKPGTYWGANVHSVATGCVNDPGCSSGLDLYAGWALTVAYSSPTDQVRNLVVYQGFAEVNRASPEVDFTLSGLRTPSRGPVNTRLSMVDFEGDINYSGDYALLNGNTFGDALNPWDNHFNSTHSDMGRRITTGTPSFVNQMGIDIDRFDITDVLPNGATRADVRIATNNEGHYPAVLAFASDFYSPSLVVKPVLSDDDKHLLERGDGVTATVSVSNQGDERTREAVITSSVPSGATLVPGSAEVISGNGSVTTTSTEVTLTPDEGVMDPDEEVVVRYRLKVGSSTPLGTSLVARSRADYKAYESGQVLAKRVDSNALVVDVARADLVLSTLTSADVEDEDTSAEWSLQVENKGPSVSGPVEVRLTNLPAGLRVPDGAPACGSASCTLPSLEVGETATIPVVLDLLSDVVTPRPTVSVSAAPIEPSASDNTVELGMRVNHAPVATGSDVVARAAGVEVDVTGLVSDADGDDLTIKDASAVHAAVDHSGRVLRYKPVPGYRGTDTITYTITDPNGRSATAELSVEVLNTAPLAQDHALDTDARGVEVDLDELVHDADGDTLSVSDVSAQHGVVSSDGLTLTYVPAKGYRGEDTVSYSVTDGHGGSATATVTITTVNTAPTVPALELRVDHLGGVVDVLVGAEDLDGDAVLLVSANAREGMLTSKDGVLTYTPAMGYRGADTITYVISDGAGGQSTGLVEVSVSNASPVAEPDTAVVKAGTNVLDVLGNDSDPDADALTVISARASTGTARVTDVNGRSVVTYVPARGQHGSGTITYVISDGFGGRATGAVTVTVENSAPVAVDDVLKAWPGRTNVLDVLGNDSDPDTDTLVVTTASLVTEGVTEEVTDEPDEQSGETPEEETGAGDGDASEPEVGTEDGDASEPEVAAASAVRRAQVQVVDGKVTFEFGAEVEGASLTYVISDGFGGTSSAQVVIEVGTGTPDGDNDQTPTPPVVTPPVTTPPVVPPVTTPPVVVPPVKPGPPVVVDPITTPPVGPTGPQEVPVVRPNPRPTTPVDESVATPPVVTTPPVELAPPTSPVIGTGGRPAGALTGGTGTAPSTSESRGRTVPRSSAENPRGSGDLELARTGAGLGALLLGSVLVVGGVLLKVASRRTARQD